MTEVPAQRALLERFGVSPKRSFGQNFLSDLRLCERIAELAIPDAGGTAVEIGAGLGALTRLLLPRTSRLVAIERDRDLIGPLRELFRSELEQGKLELLEADAKQVDYLGCFTAAPRPYRVIGNLPYQLTGPLLRRVVELSQVIDRSALLVQLEVAERVRAVAGSSDYGALSVFVQAQYRVERPLLVHRAAFYPRPRVDSALLVLSPLRPPVHEETAVFRALVKAAFAQRRKQLLNAWGRLHGRSMLESAAKGAGVDLSRRGESLTVLEFAKMANELEKLS